MRSVQKIQRFVCSSFIFTFHAGFQMSLQKDTRNENYKGRRRETNQLTHFQITAMDAKVLKDTSDHRLPRVLTKEVPTPTEGVPALHMPLGTCAHHHTQQSSSSFHQGVPTMEGWAANQKTWLMVPKIQGHGNKDSGPCRISSPPPEFTGTFPTHHCYPDVNGGWLSTARAAHFFPRPHP